MYLRRFKNYFHKFLFINNLDRTRFYDIPVNECVHYCAYRYGSDNPPPYEKYIRIFASGEKEKAREYLIDYLKFYRPHCMQEALGISHSTIRSALWMFPWFHAYRDDFFNLRRGWSDDPNQVPDIMTHFSDNGILSFRIEEEFCWLESAFYNIKKYGFNNSLSNDSCRLICLCNRAGICRYIVENGNHRLAALAVLGHKCISAQIIQRINESDSEKWPAVKNGFISLEESLNIFNAYFQTATTHNKTTEQEARIVSAFDNKESI